MIASLTAFPRRHIVMFGIVKFCAGLVIGFGLGVYFLLILIAEKGLDKASITALSDSALRRGTFVRDLPGSDGLHWAYGVIMVNADRIWLDGKIAPGPDYRLYLTPKYVETGAGFQNIKAQSRQIGPVKAFDNFYSTCQIAWTRQITGSFDLV